MTGVLEGEESWGLLESVAGGVGQLVGGRWQLQKPAVGALHTASAVCLGVREGGLEWLGRLLGRQSLVRVWWGLGSWELWKEWGNRALCRGSWMIWGNIGSWE